jgi:hypothetical protein
LFELEEVWSLLRFILPASLHHREKSANKMNNWVIEILLFNAKWAIVSGISWGEQVTFQCDDTVRSLYTTPIPLVRF